MKKILIFLGCLGLAGLGAKADSAKPVIQTIELRFQGPQNASEEALRARIALKEGQPFDELALDNSVRALYQSEIFENVKSEVKSEGAHVTFLLFPKQKTEQIVFEGAKTFSEKILLKQIQCKENEFYTESTIRESIQKLKNFYWKKGFYNCQINASITQGSVGKKILFSIEENQRCFIKKIKFIGNTHIKEKELLKKIKTQNRNWLSWITGSGVIKEEQLRNDLKEVQRYYQNQGFLDVNIDYDKIILDFPREKTVHITIPIDEGKQYFFGEIKLTGITLCDPIALKKKLFAIEGKPFSPEKTEASIESIRSHYASMGYIETDVQCERHARLPEVRLDLTFIVQESQKFYVDTIEVKGNTKTKRRVILRELALFPGEPFDAVKMKRCQERLENLGFFEEVIGIPQPSSLPDKKVLSISVKEKKTNHIGFGAMFSTSDRLSTFVELAQGNFDYSSPKNFFQGAGQKARIRGEFGSRYTSGIFQFEEPWVCDHQLAMGFELFMTKSKHKESKYNSLHRGVEVYTRKPLFEFVEGKLYYRLEGTRIDKVKADAPRIIKEERKSRIISRIGLTFTRDTRDNGIFPTEGNFVEWDNQLAGVMNKTTKFYKTHFLAAQYWQIGESMEPVLSVGGKTGTIREIGGVSIPTFEKFFLGGCGDVRGFDFNEVGPKDNDADHSPLGGKTYGFASVEYSIKLHTVIRFATFYDMGFVNEKHFKWKMSGYNSNWGVGLRVFALGAPIRFDFAFPIKTDRFNKKTCRFQFSFGTSF